MKRLAACCIAFALLIAGAFSLPARADAIDYSYIEQLGVFTIDVDEEGDAFINLDAGFPTFTHEYAVADYPSLLYSDILVLRYNTGDATPVWRIWVEYVGTEALGAYALSFRLADMVYTFDLSECWMEGAAGGYPLEQCVVVLGAENIDFWLDLMIGLEELGDLDAFADVRVPVTLHGSNRSVTFDMPADSLAFIYFMGEAMVNTVGLDGLAAIDGTPMTSGAAN